VSSTVWNNKPKETMESGGCIVRGIYRNASSQRYCGILVQVARNDLSSSFTYKQNFYKFELQFDASISSIGVKLINKEDAHQLKHLEGLGIEILSIDMIAVTFRVEE
jgi:hypothetical protein